MKTKTIQEIAKERFDILKSNELFNDDKIDKTNWETKFYECEDDYEISMSISVISPDLIVSNAAHLTDFGDINISKNPISLGTFNSLKNKSLYIYSLASAISDDIKYVVNTDLRCNGMKKSFSASLSLQQGETGRIILQINFK